MKVIEKAIMPDGTSIQLEDWSGNNTKEYPDLYGLAIGTYPIAKNSYTTWIKKGEKCRVALSYSRWRNITNEMIKADFEALKSGEKTLEDLKAHFYDNAYCFILGI